MLHSHASQPGFFLRLPEPPTRVAILRANRIGDFLCATPAFRALRRSLPGAEITLIGLPFVEDLVVRSPHLDRFVHFPGFPGMAEQFFDARAATRFFAEMQSRRLDLVIQIHGTGANSNPFALMMGARWTVGFISPYGGTVGLLDAAFALPQTGHEIARLSAFPTFLGAPVDGAEIEFPLLAEDHREADALLCGIERPLIGIHAATWDVIKRWPAERFAAAAVQLQRHTGGTVVILGARPDRGGLSAEEAACISGAAHPVLDLRGKTSLGTLGAVMTRLAVFLSNDSGPAHIAYALGIPSVTIFGGTDPARWGPLSPGPHAVLAHEVVCRPCELPACPIGYRCLQGVTPEDAVEAAEEMMRLRHRELHAAHR